MLEMRCGIWLQMFRAIQFICEKKSHMAIRLL